jgi:SAM-dependent methyltransferase
MYEFMRRFASRPAAHARSTIETLWTRPHIARRMLAFHLDPDTPFASRPARKIDEIVRALDNELALGGKRLCDLGCGPGLYASRFASLGAEVTGVDISATSIAHAKGEASRSGNRPRYLVADYLREPLDGRFEVVALIYYDYCAMSPADRGLILRKVHDMLEPGGRFVFDVVSEHAFETLEEALQIEDRLMDGFWSPSDYVGIHRKWLYRDRSLAVDHFGIVEARQSFEVFNWMQYFSRERLERELAEAGFDDLRIYGSLALESVTAESPEFGVIARKPS